VANASSSFSGFPADRIRDGNLNTSWFSACGDAANQGQSPWAEVVFPFDVTVVQINIRGNREFADGFDIFAGRIDAFDAQDQVLFTQDVELPSPTRDVDVPLSAPLGSVLRVRFTSTQDESCEPGFSELEVIGTPGVTMMIPNIDVTPTSLDFGNISLGQGQDLTLSVRNLGTATLTVNSITSDNQQFSVTSPSTPFTVAAGSQQTVNVQFTPTLAGSQSATLSISSNDPDEATVSVALTGTGVAPSVRTLSVPNGQGMAGTTVSVPINLSDGSAISALRFTLTFDPAILSIPNAQAISRGTLVPENFSLSASLLTPGQVTVLIAPPLQSPVPTLPSGSGTVAVIAFQVAEGTPDRATSLLHFTLASASDPNADAVQISPQDGTFTVRNVLLGDVNDDRQVSEQDLIELIQHLTGERPLTGLGLEAADTNCDGQVNEQDLVRLIQHLTGERLLPERCLPRSALKLTGSVYPERAVRLGDVAVDGEGLLVPIQIDDGRDVAAVGLLVKYDPELVNITEVMVGELVPAGFTLYAKSIKPGELKILLVPPVMTPIPTLMPGEGALVKLRVQVFGAEHFDQATNSLKLVEAILSDSEGRAIDRKARALPEIRTPLNRQRQ
jgi:hypothetical protein